MIWIKRILELSDHEIEIYLSRVKLNKFARVQRLSMSKLFPNDGKTCACGCGKKLTNRQKRWASIKCQEFPYRIYNVIRGDRDTIFTLVKVRDGSKCAKCGKTEDKLWKDILNNPTFKGNSPLELDHIHPVYKGGGGCWIDNYQLLCYDCHKAKTKKDRRKPKRKK